MVLRMNEWEKSMKQSAKDDVLAVSVRGLLELKYGRWYAARQPQTLREARLRYLREWRLGAAARRRGAKRVRVMCRWCLLVECFGKWVVGGVFGSEAAAGRAREEFVARNVQVMLVDLALLLLRHGESGGNMGLQDVRMREADGRERLARRAERAAGAVRKRRRGGKLVARMEQVDLEGV